MRQRCGEAVLAYAEVKAVRFISSRVGGMVCGRRFRDSRNRNRLFPVEVQEVRHCGKWISQNTSTQVIPKEAFDRLSVFVRLFDRNSPSP
jgi:hypothetical protein